MKKPEEVDILGHVAFDSHHDDEIYGADDVKKDFDTLQSWGTYYPHRVKVVAQSELNRKVIQVKYPKGKLRSFDSGASWFWRDFGEHQDLYLSFWVKFPFNFDFRRGGKMHGLCGGACNTGGRKPNGHDGWSSRVHWGPEDNIKQYIYHKDQPDNKYGQEIYWTKNPEPIIIEPGKEVEHYPGTRIKITKNVWHYIVTRVVINDIGVKNGLVQSWFDGELVLNVHGIEFRDQSCSEDELLIDKMYFCTFFGGDSRPYEPSKDEYAYFNDFRISKGMYIPPKESCDEIEDGIVMKPPRPTLFETDVPGTDGKYGFGMHLEWIPHPGLATEYYEVQYTTDLELHPDKWITYQSKRPVSHGSWINHHGDIRFRNYVHCLPSEQTYFYRVRALDASNKAITGWSNVVSGTMGTYGKLRMIRVEPTLFEENVPDETGKYGYGMHLEWTPSVDPDVEFYEIEFTTDKDLESANWKTLSEERSKKFGGWINHHGNHIHHDYIRCLPSGQTYSYRVRPLAADKSSLSDWSDALSGTVEDYD